MSRYNTPDIGDHTIAYKGRRYWLIKMDGKTRFDLNDPDDSDYVMYDRLYEATIALLTVDKDGKFTASLMSHVELAYEYDTIEDAIADIPHQMNRYQKGCGF